MIDESGPSHVAFHMLQSMFIVCKDMMRWAQCVVNAEKINVNKAPESFDVCRKSCMTFLQEIKRLAVDLFLADKEDETSSTCVRNSDAVR